MLGKQPPFEQNQLILRRASEADSKHLSTFLRQLLSETDYLLPEREDVEDYLQLLLKNKLQLIVSPGGELIVGYLVEQKSIYSKKSHCVQVAIGLLKNYWGKGLARSLLKDLKERCKLEKVGRVELTVRTDNHSAIKLYLAQGFLVEGVKRNSICVKGRYYSEYIMAFCI